MTSDARERLRNAWNDWRDLFGHRFDNGSVAAKVDLAIAGVLAESPAAAHGDHDALDYIEDWANRQIKHGGHVWGQSMPGLITLVRELRDRPRAVPDAGALLSILHGWAYRYGEALCPRPGYADSFGDGMRCAKKEIAEMLARAPQPQPQPAPEEPYCEVDDYSSRVCQRGTKCCTVDHDAGAQQREEPQASEAAKREPDAYLCGYCGDIFGPAGKSTHNKQCPGAEMRERFAALRKENEELRKERDAAREEVQALLAEVEKLKAQPPRVIADDETHGRLDELRRAYDKLLEAQA